jgi:hypothetical protein
VNVFEPPIGLPMRGSCVSGYHLQVVPNHACGCINLHDGLLAVRDGIVDPRDRIAGRGLIR